MRLRRNRRSHPLRSAFSRAGRANTLACGMSAFPPMPVILAAVSDARLERVCGEDPGWACRETLEQTN